MKFVTLNIKAVYADGKGDEGDLFVPVRMFVADDADPEEVAWDLGRRIERALNTIDLGDEE